MPIVESITTSFSAAGARVLLVPGPAAAEAHRAANDHELAVARHAVRALGRDAVVAELVLTASPSADTAAGGLAALNERAMRDEVAPGMAVDSARADLIITMLPSNADNDASVETLAIAAARMLVFGGVLAVYTHTDWSTGRLIDPSGPMIAAAQNADLLYLQHIVTLHTPIRNGRLHPPPGSVGPTHDDAGQHAYQLGAPAPHARVHGDVLVFAQAHADTADLR
ncbi:hypothetical protein [Amycolatopsis sp. lyj-346]|uniref:hypothetical protein n=1 Tax=Amycolatopsis sp. lyj-346 TaxID=2789289 RepID=UPI00397C44D9